MRRATAALAIVLAALLPAAASPLLPYHGKNRFPLEAAEWRVYRAPHFDVHYTTDAEPDLARLVDLAEAAWRRLAADLEHVVPARIPLVAYATQAELVSSAPAGEGGGDDVLGFAEPALGRMAVSLDLADEDLARLVAHELAHVFEFSIVFGGLRATPLARRPPAWAMEGFAERASGPIDATGRMWLADLALGRAPFPHLSALELAALPSPRLGYELGRAAFDTIEERWGQAGVRKLWAAFAADGVGSAWTRALGLDNAALDAAVETHVRRTYGATEGRADGRAEGRTAAPAGAVRMALAAPLDQVVALAAAPAGETLAVLATDRKTGALELAVVSAADGRVRRRLGRGERFVHDGAIPRVRPIAFDAKGERLAVFARGDRDPVLLVYDVASGRRLARIEVQASRAGGPSFSPDGRWLAFAAVRAARGDVFVLDLETGAVRNVTDDAAFDRAPAFDPGGRSIVYVTRDQGFDRLARVSLAGGGREVLTAGEWNDFAPVFDAVQGLLWTSDRGGRLDVWRLEPGAGEAARLTESETGDFSPVLVAGAAPALTWISYRDGRFDLASAPLPAVREHVLLRRPDEEVAPPAGSPPARVWAALEPAAGGLLPSRRLSTGRLRDVAAALSADREFGGRATVELEDLLGTRKLALTAGAVRGAPEVHGTLTLERRRLALGFEGYDLATRFDADPALAAAGGRSDPSPLVTQRVAGGAVLASYPFSVWRRLELRAGAERIDRAFRRADVAVAALTDGTALPIGVALAGETTRFAPFGPLTGSTFRLAAAWAPPAGRLLSFVDLEADCRTYLPLARATVVALRLDGFFAGGDDPRFHAFGGTSEARGSDLNGFAGTRGFFANAELRFPLVAAARPASALGGLRGTLFFDLAGAWREGLPFRFTRGDRLEDARASLGAGLSVGLLGVPLHVDWALPTDLERFGRSRFQGWLGFDF